MQSKLQDFIYRLTHWETWHHHAKYIPILPVWAWYTLKAKSMWFFTASNPTISFGGMEGESKEETYSQLPEGTFPQTIYISPSEPFATVEKRVKENNFEFPFAVKPNVGMMGFMFRKINSIDQLRHYHEKMPIDYLVQKFIEYPLEVGVFYYRMPHQNKGKVSGLAYKLIPEIIGDGNSTLMEHLNQTKSRRFDLEMMKYRHQSNLNKIIPLGEKYLLSNASNGSQGGKMVAYQSHKLEYLNKIFDEISLYKGNLFYGRFDIKCTSLKDLEEGKNFSILEFNGCGSGIQHIYGRGFNLIQVWVLVLKHWRMLYKISVHNHNNGVPYWSFSGGLTFLKKAKQNLEMLKKLDAEFPSFQ